MRRKENEYLEAEAGLAPMPPLGIVPNGVAGAEPDPLRNGPVLLLGLGQLLLDTESLVARHFNGLLSREPRCCRYGDGSSRWDWNIWCGRQKIGP